MEELYQRGEYRIGSKISGRYQAVHAVGDPGDRSYYLSERILRYVPSKGNDVFYPVDDRGNRNAVAHRLDCIRTFKKEKKIGA